MISQTRRFERWGLQPLPHSQSSDRSRPVPRVQRNLRPEVPTSSARDSNPGTTSVQCLAGCCAISPRPAKEAKVNLVPGLRSIAQLFPFSSPCAHCCKLAIDPLRLCLGGGCAGFHPMPRSHCALSRQGTLCCMLKASRARARLSSLNSDHCFRGTISVPSHLHDLTSLAQLNLPLPDALHLTL